MSRTMPRMSDAAGRFENALSRSFPPIDSVISVASSLSSSWESCEPKTSPMVAPSSAKLRKPTLGSRDTRSRPVKSGYRSSTLRKSSDAAPSGATAPARASHSSATETSVSPASSAGYRSIDMLSPRATYCENTSVERWHFETARRENSHHRLADLGVRCARARGDPQRYPSRRKPVARVGLDVLETGQPVVNRAGVGIDPFGRFDVIGGHLLGAERRERDRIARVEPSDHDHGVECFLEQLLHGVLTLLRGAADGVEGAEIALPRVRIGRAHV